MSYIVPDCKKCFLQRDLLRLGSVCRKFNELTKVADFYKEIKLSDECCSLPTPQVLAQMLNKSGSKLKKIVCSYKCEYLLYVAVANCIPFERSMSKTLGQYDGLISRQI